MTDPQPFLSVVVMAYNEVGTVIPFFDELHGVLRDSGKSFEVLFVDDGSSDGTERMVDQIARQHDHVSVIHHRPNQGLGAVYRSGFKNARGNWVSFFPADGQFPADIVNRFLPFTETHDLILGFLPDVKRPFVGRMLSYVERVLYRVLFGVIPAFQGVFLCRRELIVNKPLQYSGRGWANVMELIIRSARAGYRTVSVPTVLRPRVSGVSKVNNWRTIFSNFIELLKLQPLLSRGRP